MKSASSITNWSALFFSAFRRKPSSKIYQYKHGVSKIKGEVLSNFTENLARKDLEPILVHCERQLFTSSVAKLREIILQDINAPTNAIIKTSLTGTASRPKKKEEPLVVSSWQNIAPIFIHAVYPLSELEARDKATVFEFKHTIKLSSADGQQVLSHVHWPDLIFSHSCQAIGVSAEKYNELPSEVRFINPSNGNPLRIIKVDSIPNGCDAIGLFPAHEVSHRDYFSGLELCGALIRHKPCVGSQRANIEKWITSSSQTVDSSNMKDTRTPDEPTSETDFPSLKKLMDASTKWRALWSTSQDSDRTCPGDIIRCTLTSRKTDTEQFLQEFCKHYVLFTTASQALRLYRKIGDTSIQDIELRYEPADLYVWQRYLELNEMPQPSSVVEMVQYKERLDELLVDLGSYYFSVVAEMKSSSQLFFEADKTAPRAVAVLKILSEVLQGCKGIRMFYPNLSLDLTNTLSEMAILKEAKLPDLTSKDKELQLGLKVVTLFQHLAEIESVMYNDRLAATKPFQVSPLSPSMDWKIVILSKVPLPPAIERMLLFNSKIYTQCVTDLKEVSLKKFSTCKARRMVDEDTFVFLYQSQRPPKVDGEEMVDKILDKLETAGKSQTA